MARRHEAALGIVNPGAINPSGICTSILEACREVHDEGGSTQRDPAIRLMVHQLAHVCKISDLDKLDIYTDHVRLCREHVQVDKVTSQANAMIAGRAS